MQGSFNSRTYNINTLLGRSSFPDLSVKRVVVPPFQRGYSWEKLHVSTFWDDVRRFHDEAGKPGAIATYFLGPIVIMPGENSVVLLDGQQRLATATILLSVIREHARTLGQAGSDLARDIQRDLIFVDEDAGLYALSLNEQDEEFFLDFVKKDPAEAGANPKIRSHLLMRQAKQYLSGQVAGLIEGAKPNEAVKLLKQLKVTLAEKLKLVVIEVASEDEAFLIFETLNDRGLRLSVPDLLLNHLMRGASTQKKRESVRTSWGEVIDNVAKRNLSSFLRHMWVSSYGDVKAQSLYREIKRRLADEQIDVEKFAKRCADESEKYVAILDLDMSVLGEALPYARGIVKSLGADMALPLLLSGLTCLESQDFVKLCRLTLAILVRYVTVANLNPAALEVALFNAARKLRVGKDQDKFGSAKLLAEVRNQLKKLNPSSHQIIEGMQELYLDKATAIFFLSELARTLQSPTKAFAVDKVSVEHIFPENAEKKSWPNESSLRPYLWHVGNLTLLEPKLNKDLGNGPLSTKLAGYMKSGIELTRQISAQYSSWDEKEVIQRAKSMAKLVDQTWVIN